MTRCKLFVILFVLFEIQSIRCDISPNVKNECQKTKGCLFKPAGCTPFDNCIYFMSYQMKPNTTDTVIIELLTTLSGTQNQWVAVGFSNDEKMGDDAVTYCIYSLENQVPIGAVRRGYNPGYSNQVVETGSVVRLLEAGVINTTFLCRFEQTIAPAGSDVNGRTKPLNNSYNLFLVGGQMDPTNTALIPHSQNRLDQKFPYISGKVNITDNSLYSSATGADAGASGRCVGDQTSSNLVKAHGILMVFGWWLFVATAIIFARYFRTSWPGKKIMGTLIWFNCHRGLNIIGVLMIASAFICIFIAECGEWAGIRPTTSNHAITGMTACIAAFVQPIIAALRCHPGTAKRPIFNWIHRFIGLGAFCCACATIWFATNFDYLDYEHWGYAPRGMMIFYWVVLVVVVIALELLITISERIQRKKITNEMHMQGLKGEPSTEGAGFISTPLWNTLRLALLGLFVIIALAVAITLACFIGLSA